MPDIDIDFVDRDQALKLFKHIKASRIDEGKLVKHNTGVYLHEVPVDAVSGLCSVDYTHAEDQSYFKETQNMKKRKTKIRYFKFNSSV